MESINFVPAAVNPNPCPACHQAVEPAYYFCPNCGHNLKPAPPKTSPGSQIELYLKSILLPPFGFIWGYHYLKQKDTKSKLIGLTAIVLTLVILVVVVKTTVALVNTVNEQVNSQMENLF